MQVRNTFCGESVFLYRIPKFDPNALKLPSLIPQHVLNIKSSLMMTLLSSYVTIFCGIHSKQESRKASKQAD